MSCANSNCHPERSEGSRQRREILRFAQDDKAFARRHRTAQGFTLLEILVALFITTILSLLLIQALHHAFIVEAQLTAHNKRLHQLQMTALTLTHSIGKTIPQSAWVGKPDIFIFTSATLNYLAKEEFKIANGSLWYRALKAASVTNKEEPWQSLLTGITQGHFEYLDQHQAWHKEWPPAQQVTTALPKAVRFIATLADWGDLSQTFIIAREE